MVTYYTVFKHTFLTIIIIQTFFLYWFSVKIKKVKNFILFKVISILYIFNIFLFYKNKCSQPPSLCILVYYPYSVNPRRARLGSNRIRFLQLFLGRGADQIRPALLVLVRPEIRIRRTVRQS